MKRSFVLLAFAAVIATTAFALPSVKTAVNSCCGTGCCQGGNGDCCK